MMAMTERFLKKEAEKDNLASLPEDDFLPGAERPDLFLPVATVVSPVSPESRMIVYSDPRSIGADRFRLARIRLKSLQATKGLKTLLITSPLPGDGKSTVALNLATALAENGKRPVLLLEADVYRPSLVKKLGVSPWPGLTECFQQGIDPMLAIRRIEPLGFYLLPVGHPTDEDSFLQSKYALQLIKKLAAISFSWIVIDAPPSTPVADILTLKAQADATLLVVRAGRTPREAIDETTRNLGRDHIMGIILNGVEGLDHIYSKYYGYVKPEAQRKSEKSKSVQGLGLKNK
jgi:Mrp family chromosome partitioning ATPase